MISLLQRWRARKRGMEARYMNWYMLSMMSMTLCWILTDTICRRVVSCLPFYYDLSNDKDADHLMYRLGRCERQSTTKDKSMVELEIRTQNVFHVGGMKSWTKEERKARRTILSMTFLAVRREDLRHMYAGSSNMWSRRKRNPAELIIPLRCCIELEQI